MILKAYNFGKRLKLARKLCGFTQAQLAKATGLEASAISHFETGRRKPSLKNFCAIRNALRVTAEWLLTDGASK